MKALKMTLVATMALSLLYGCGASTGDKKTAKSGSVVVSKAAMMSPISVADSVTYAKTSGASSKVMAECTIDRQLPDFVKSYSSKNDIAIVPKKGKVSSKDKGKVLVMEFSNITGASGGAWSGAKSVTVEGNLYENGKKIGSFLGRRMSGGGAWGAYKGTCSILGRCVKSLGNDIAGWLANPTMDARIGEL